MSSLLLTEQERDRFASWLEHEAATSKGLIEQLEKLGPAMTMMIPHQKAEVAAALLIARRLRATHSDSIGGGGGMSTDTTRAAMQAARDLLADMPIPDGYYSASNEVIGLLDAALKQQAEPIRCKEKLKPGGCQLHNLHCGWPKCNEAPAQPQQAEASPATLTERDHFDLALWHKKLGELADAYYEAGRTHPARQRARAALMLHALDCATGWRARSAKPQQAEPVTVEAVAEVVRTEDGLDLSWLVEGGICAMEDGVVLLMSHRPITDDFGHGEVYTAPPAHSAKPQQAEPVKLHENEQYILQMAGISTAALGYWKEGDPIHPDYITMALLDVAKLYAKYAALAEQQAEPAAEGREPAP